jgi:hypothetical protein
LKEAAAGYPSRVVVDFSTAAGAVCAICGSSLFSVARARIRLQNQSRLIVKNNEIAIAGAPTIVLPSDCAGPSTKSPMRLSARAQLTQFRSFNFPNNLICPVESTTLNVG